MRKARLMILAIIGLFYATMAVAHPHHQGRRHYSANEYVLLRDQPSASANVVDKVLPTARLVTIFYHKDWVKVGDRQTGKVGWVNKKQFHQAQKAFFRPNLQTVFVSTSSDKQGKPTTTVIAYKNGKKLSNKEAKALYRKIEKQQKQEQQKVDQQFATMNKMFEQDMKAMQNMFAS